MLARRRAPREGLGDRTLVSIEQRQLERHPERALGVEGAPSVFAYPIAAPGIGRGDMKLRPAPGDFTLQAELRQVVFTQRVRDLGPPDESLRPPARRAGIEQRLAQRRADLPDRFRQLRLRKCGLQGRLLPRPRTLGGTAQKEIQ